LGRQRSYACSCVSFAPFGLFLLLGIHACSPVVMWFRYKEETSSKYPLLFIFAFRSDRLQANGEPTDAPRLRVTVLTAFSTI
jgi:hypothetical protein